MNKQKNNRRIISLNQILVWVAIFAVAVFFFNRPGGQTKELNYSDFKQKVASGEVSDLTVAPAVITGTLKDEHAVATYVEAELDVKISKYLPPRIDLAYLAELSVYNFTSLTNVLDSLSLLYCLYTDYVELISSSVDIVLPPPIN